MKTILILFAALAVFGLPAARAADAASAATAAPKNRLVLQVSDEDAKKWNTVLNNAHNVQVDLGQANVEIEIVAYGPGIGMLKADSLVANRVEDGMADGIRFVACGNTMQAQKLTKDDMIDKIDYAKAGIVRLMQRQQQGWVYIRP
jgi:intracellular sulfur oxidation DsrE/DsrF family protein